jgi:hypothetical protein
MIIESPKPADGGVGMRKCRRCTLEYERTSERCPACKMPATGPASIVVPR